MARVPQPLLRSQKLVKRKKRLRIVKIILGLIIFCGAIYGLWYAAQLPQFAIENIVVEGNVTLSTDDVTNAVQSKLDGSYFHLISRSNILVYPKQDIVRAIKALSLRVSDVSIERSLWNTIVITLTERVPVSAWCGVTAPIHDEESDCYLLDKTGFIFDTAPEFSGTAYRRMYGAISSSTPLQAIYGSGHFTTVRTFLDGLSTLQLPVTTVTMQADDYIVILKNGVELRLNYLNSGNETISALQSVLNQKQFANGAFDTVDYVDMRYGNKIFYKFKGTTPVVTDSTTAKTAQ